MTESYRGWRLLWGGSGPEGMDPRFVRRFIELAGGVREAHIAVVPTASEERADTIARYQESFELEGVRRLDVLDIRERAAADEPAMLAKLREATGVMLTGGDQLRLLDILGGTGFAAELLRRGRDGLLVGGSSAGSMALGDPVIVRGDPAEFFEPGAIRHLRGFGLLDGVTVDTHFMVRGRLGRLVAMVSEFPEVIGLGIDEDCGLEVSPDGVATVMGRAVVCVVDAHRAEPRPAVAAEGRGLSVSGLALHVLADGDRYDLRTRRARRA